MELVKDQIERVTDGQCVLYKFLAGAGDIVHDVSGVEPLLYLQIMDKSATRWTENGLAIDGPTLIASASEATKINEAIKASGALTLEIWHKPASTMQPGKAHLVTLSQDTYQRNLTLSQSGAAYNVRLRTTSTDINGSPSLEIAVGDVANKVTHLVYTRDVAGNTKFYLDGVERMDVTVDGSTDVWTTSYRLALANESTGGSAWLGELYLVAIYDRALQSSDVLQNFNAGIKPVAPEKTSKVLDYLKNLSSKSIHRVVSGQRVHDARVSDKDFQIYIEDLAAQTGHYVGFIEMGYMNPLVGIENTKKVNAYLIDYWEKGGLVGIQVALDNPVTGGDRKDKSTVVLKDLYTDGQPGYDQFHSELDKIAEGLRELQQHGVEVLFRPFHEMNGRWFWWGADQDDKQFQELWIHTHDYLTKKHELNNIIWVFSGSHVDPLVGGHGGSLMARYPGNNYVDVVGFSMYTCSPKNYRKLYNKLIKIGKPFVFGENGPDGSCIGTWDNELLIKDIKGYFPETVYFLQWRGQWAIVNNKNATGLLNDPWIVNRGGIDIER